MALLTRIWNLIRAAVSSWVDRMEDPSANFDLRLHELDDRYRQAREKVVLALATRKRLERSVAAATEEARLNRDLASAAVKKGQAAAARLALERCRRASAKADSDGRALESVAGDVKTLQTALGRMEERLLSAGRRRDELGGMLQVGEAKMSMAGLSEGLADLEEQRSGSAERQLSDHVERLNAEGEVRLELTSGASELEELARELALSDARLARLPAGRQGGE